MALRRLASVAIVTLTIAAACSSSTSPGASSGIRFLAGDHQTDTIDAQLTQALNIAITSVPRSQTLRGQVVQFIAVLDSAQTSYEAEAEKPDQQTPQSFLAESLSANGQASAVIVLGTKAGPARLVVKVPGFGFVDTARFTVTPGKAATLIVSPTDTTIITGASIGFQTNVTDRAGNPRTDPVQLAVTSGPATASGKTVMETAVGRITVVASEGSLKDTMHVSSVPPGVVAASTGNGIVTFNMDGSHYTNVLQFGQYVGNVKWAPSGTSLAFDQNGPACYGGGNLLHTTDLQGNVTLVDPGGTYDAYPSYSRDGTWIYFTRYASSTGSNWRVHPDGTNGDSLATLNPGLDLWPSPSPNGQQVAYGAYYIDSPMDHVDLRILTLSSGAVTDLHTIAWSPEWAPSSNQIAFISGTRCDSGNIMIINADGTGARVLNANVYQPSFDWSPDGQWLVALNAGSGQIEVINASTGATVPLTFTSSLSSPTWKP